MVMTSFLWCSSHCFGQQPSCSSIATCLMRNPETHFKQCSKLDGPLIRDHYYTDYGINRLSVLEEVPEFSVSIYVLASWHHARFVLRCGSSWTKALLSHFKYFTLAELNDRHIAFDFPENKPRTIWDISNVRQSASQMMIVLPLIIGDRIPSDDKHWESMLLLLSICQLVMAPVFSDDNVSYLAVIIEE